MLGRIWGREKCGERGQAWRASASQTFFQFPSNSGVLRTWKVSQPYGGSLSETLCVPPVASAAKRPVPFLLISAVASCLLKSQSQTLPLLLMDSSHPPELDLLQAMKQRNAFISFSFLEFIWKYDNQKQANLKLRILGTWFNDSVRLTVGLDDIKHLFQQKWFYEIIEETRPKILPEIHPDWSHIQREH